MKKIENKGFIVEIHYHEEDDNGFVINSDKIKFTCMPLKGLRTMVTDGKVLFTLDKSPTKEYLGEWFANKFAGTSKIIFKLELTPTTFSYDHLKKLDEMETFRLKAAKKQQECDRLFEKFNLIQQAFVLLT